MILMTASARYADAGEQKRQRDRFEPNLRTAVAIGVGLDAWMRKGFAAAVTPLGDPHRLASPGANQPGVSTFTLGESPAWNCRLPSCFVCTTWPVKCACRRPKNGVSKMRALGKGDVRVDTVPHPKIHHPRDAIIKITACAICGSDLDLWAVTSPPWRAAISLVMKT